MLEIDRDNRSDTPSEVHDTLSSAKNVSRPFSSAAAEEVVVPNALIRFRLRRGCLSRYKSSEEEYRDEDCLKGKSNFGGDDSLHKLSISIERCKIIASVY